MEIVTIKSKNRKILKRKTPNFDFKKHGADEIKTIIAEMRKTMKSNDGVGLSSNQVGLNWRLFVAEYDKKFYVIFNPRITKSSEKISVMEEGCLSVPDVIVEVPRSETITLEAEDKNGKKLKIKAFGVLARIFQHETDHLNGKLITDYL
ncbi:MAG: peptide deformylase [Parcubacteria group bacterium]|jgi:peptide deformylase